MKALYGGLRLGLHRVMFARVRGMFLAVLAGMLGMCACSGAPASVLLPGEVQVRLEPGCLKSSSPLADFSGLLDEQAQVGFPPTIKATNGWKIPSQYGKQFPFSATLDLGTTQYLAGLWVFDTHNVGGLSVSVGQPGAWQEVTNYNCGAYLSWVRLPLMAATRHLRLELKSPGANFSEIVLSAFTPAAWETMQRERLQQQELSARRAAALAQARAEVERRPWIELAPFGRVRVVEEVDCSRPEPGQQFRESPAGITRVENLLGRPHRVLAPSPNEAAYMAFRVGRYKLLQPGAAYVLAVDYPEDAPRSFVLLNGGNETSRGWHTGNTLGDALHAKYVNSNVESLRVPLSGKTETWTCYFRLHDRFPDLLFLRGAGPRSLEIEDGFDVVIAQFSARNDPTSRGAAVARIRLLEVPAATDVAQPLVLPPAPLPQRVITWREEMADGVIESDKLAERGVSNRLDWYRFKVSQMKFLGLNCFSKDLLEFGACQHWDSTPYGGNDWVFFNGPKKDLWAQVVQLLGTNGLSVLPYYEYAGSKGYRGLGPQRRAKPLTRDDAFTHISWIESSNADITDPESLADFTRMLDLTVLRLRDQASFRGVWVRPRSQLPMGFGDRTRERFAREASQGVAVTRQQLQDQPELLKRYEQWWFGKRRDFLAGVRDFLRTNGLPEANVLFTADASEPGVSFPTWEKRVVTDDVSTWQGLLKGEEHLEGGKSVAALAASAVVAEKQFLSALLSPPLNWGKWEVHHANPPADPSLYQPVPGVLLTHGFNRYYTVASPATFEAFRTPAGLAAVRHHALNEDMMFDAQGKSKLGYFVADMERAGPYCMLAEAQAVAQGDPSLVGYLLGNNLARGFPQYVRRFNANYLALPALPSRRLPAGADAEVVVRSIATEGKGTYLAIVNTGLQAKPTAEVRLPTGGSVQEVVSGRPLVVRDGVVTLALDPCELRTLKLVSR
jgi:hypothetical protein